MEKVFGKTGWLYADKSTLTTFPGLNTKVHRIRKQILKLSPKLQKAIIRYHEENATDILEDYHCYQYATCRRKFLKHLEIKGELPRDVTQLVINTCIDKWFSHLMEIYIIARMLYCIEQGTSKNVSIFTGAYHTYAVDYFFKNYLKDSAKHLWKYDSEQEKSTNVRCVYIPTEIIQSMVK
jgi:serine/threonine-protein kinase RIO1